MNDKAYWLNKTHIGTIPNNLVFELLPAFHTPFDENLRTQTQALSGEITQFFGVVCKAGTESAESEGGAQDDRVSDFFGGLERSGDR